MSARIHFSSTLTVCCLCLSLSPGANAATRAAKAAAPVAATTPVAYDKLDNAYQALSTGFYAEFIRTAKLTRYPTLDQLDIRVQTLLNNRDPVTAVGTLIYNLKLLNQNIDNPKIINFMALLLEQNEFATAEKLRTRIKEEAGKALQANIAYLFAQHYFLRDNWDKTLANLEGITTELPQQRYHHALLMQGIALQKLKQHRPALAHYEKIPPGSVYYDVARLNMAVANIRQDWWTDAHIIIDSLLADPKVRLQNDDTDRLYTILGYSFLQQAYYRNARDAFRNVGLKGPYTHQALLGIALAAANQEDYIGALNAVRILKEYKSLDLPVDESYLLMPYFYERLVQHATASAGYNEAIQYYENRINDLTATRQLDAKAFSQNVGFLTDGTLSLQFNVIDINDKAPAAFIRNYHLLQRLQHFIGKGTQPEQEQQFTRLQSAYQTALHDLVNAALTERIGFLTDYMNQSRYGIARLLDKNDTALN